MVYLGPLADYEPPAPARCWLCGVEPVALHDITTLGEAGPRYWPQWPADTDHRHAVRPPTPAELEQAGHEALSRIQREATTWTT